MNVTKNEKEASESSEHNQRKNTRSREPVERYVPTCAGKRYQYLGVKHENVKDENKTSE